jgi:hypothetical protein
MDNSRLLRYCLVRPKHVWSCREPAANESWVEICRERVVNKSWTSRRQNWSWSIGCDFLSWTCRERVVSLSWTSRKLVGNPVDHPHSPLCVHHAFLWRRLQCYRIGRGTLGVGNFCMRSCGSDIITTKAVIWEYIICQWVVLGQNTIFVSPTSLAELRTRSPRNFLPTSVLKSKKNMTQIYRRISTYGGKSSQIWSHFVQMWLSPHIIIS